MIPAAIEALMYFFMALISEGGRTGVPWEEMFQKINRYHRNQRPELSPLETLWSGLTGDLSETENSGQDHQL